MNHAIELGVAIERVRVCTGVVASRPAPVFVAGHLGSNGRAAPHDHRIVIRELRIDVEAALDASGARNLGKQVAWAVAHQLVELQARRWRRSADSASASGPIYVEALRVHLRGEVAQHPASLEIAAALMSAFEGEVRDAV